MNQAEHWKASQAEHLRAWIKEQRRQKLRQFAWGFAAMWAIGAAILLPVFWMAGR